MHGVAHLHESTQTLAVVTLQIDHDHVGRGTERRDAGNERPQHAQPRTTPPRQPEALDEPDMVIDHGNADAILHPV